jgi:hypothetical protein
LAGLHGYADSFPILLKNTKKQRNPLLDVDKPKKFVMICSVVVAHNRFKSRLLMRIAFGDSQRVQPICSSKRLFYLCIDFRTPHDSSESAWTAWKKTPHTSTPLVQNVTSVDLATGKATGTSVVNKASCISEQIRQAHLGLFWFFNLIGVNE